MSAAPKGQYRASRAELTELLELGPVLTKPVRNLSLGERMKCEIALALLHRPRVVSRSTPSGSWDPGVMPGPRHRSDKTPYSPSPSYSMLFLVFAPSSFILSAISRALPFPVESFLYASS